jgi:hypothetical protein
MFGFEGLSFDIVIQSLFYTAAGVVAHVFKRSMNEKISPWCYLVMYKGRTIAAMSTVVTSYIGLLMTAPEAGGAAFFAIGYILDSAVNKAPNAFEVEHGEGVKLKPDLNHNGIPDEEEDFKPLN